MVWVHKDEFMTMTHILSWQYDEFKQVGKGYGSKAEVDIYDSNHKDFRDMLVESINILDSLEITGSDVVIDFGLEPGLSLSKEHDAVPECMPLMFHRLCSSAHNPRPLRPDYRTRLFRRSNL